MAKKTKYVGPKTTSGQVLAGTGVVCGAFATHANTTMQMYDNLAGTGTLIIDTTTLNIGYNDLGNVQCTVGCYVFLNGTPSVTFYTLEGE